MKRRDLLFGGAALTAMSAWPRLNAAAPATNNLVAFIGDSRTVDAFRTGTLSTVGYPAWARALGGGRLVFDQSLVFAKGGAVSGEITAAFLEPCIASDAATVVCMMGTNDSRRVQRSLDSTLANYRKLVQARRWSFAMKRPATTTDWSTGAFSSACIRHCTISPRSLTTSGSPRRGTLWRPFPIVSRHATTSCATAFILVPSVPSPPVQPYGASCALRSRARHPIPS